MWPVPRGVSALLGALLGATFVLSACADAGIAPLPQRIRSAPTITPLPPATRAPAAGGDDDLTAEATALPPVLPTATFTPTPESAMLPAGGGVRPAQAQLLRPLESGPAAPVDWRPPPVPVPHALHPDDHYWLARPLPSDRRNYDLEWYPYGIEPMLAAALPYRVHHGMDFPNETGTSIFAAGSGEVIWAGPLRSNRNGVNYYGNTVIILHDWQWLGQDVYTLYAHTLELFVQVGDHVEKGELIAGVGASGEVSGPHLHLEVRVGENNYSSTRNPVLWLAPYEGWGTLAGRFVDSRGRMIHGALVKVEPVRIDTGIQVPVRRQRTYVAQAINPDDVWNENFVVGDLPAGEYRVELYTAGQTFRRTVRVEPGLTNFIVVQADFQWFPTATPPPTATALPTEAASGVEPTG